MSEFSPRRETAGEMDFPFASLLQDLKARGIGIGLHEYNAVGKLLSRWQGASPEEFGNAVAALLAKDEREAALVRGAFRERYVRDPGPAPAGAPRAPRTPGATDATDAAESANAMQPVRCPWWLSRPAVIAVIAAAAAAVLLLALSLAIPSRTATVDPGKAQVPPQADRQPPPPPEPARVSDWFPLAAVGVMAGGACALLAFWVISGRSRREFIHRLRRSTFAAIDGPYQYEWNVTLPPSLQKSAIEDMAAVLGRTFPEERPGRLMDVDETLRRTLHAGLWPHLVFRPSVRQMVIVVLRDMSADMRPWARGVDELLAELRRQGIALDLWTFDRNPAWIARNPRDARVPFSSLGARASDEALLVIGTGSGLASAAADLPAWAEHVSRWERRAWLNPVRHPGEWPPALQGLPIGVWPMTADGLLQAAIEVASGERDARARDGLRIPRRVTYGDIEQMKRLLAFAPQPTVELAEAMRLHFCGDIPREVILHLSPPGAPADRIALEAADARRYVLTEERDSPARAARIRAFLGSLLERSEPVPESAAHLRWELDAALLALGRESPSSPASIKRTFERLADSPIAHEIAPRLDRLAPDGAERGGLARELRRAADRGALRVPSIVPANVSVPPVPVGRVPWWPLLGSVAVGLLAAATLRVSGLSASVPLAHVEDAYRLEYVDQSTRSGALRAAINRTDANVPESVQLYRESAPDGASRNLTGDSTWPVQKLSGGTYYQVRGQLPDGRLALSNWVWVPAPTAGPPVTNADVPVTSDSASGILTITRMPDGVTIADVAIDGVRASGNTLRLPAGVHTVALTNPMFEYRRSVSIEQGRTTEFAIDAKAAYGFADVRTNVRDVQVRVLRFVPLMANENVGATAASATPVVTTQQNGATIRGAAGALIVRVSANYYLPQDVEGRIVAGARTNLAVQLRPDRQMYDDPALQTQQAAPGRSVQGLSGPKASGIGKEFSPWYSVCAEIPDGAKILNVAFRLQGDRTTCGNLAECREGSRTATQACYSFRLQGDETKAPAPSYAEGVITVTYAPPASKRR